MLVGMSTFSRALVFAACLWSAQAHKACYTSDGQLSASDSPCNIDANESFCCGLGELCLAGGMCQPTDSSAQSVTRATCTDSSWQSAACPAFCTNITSPGSSPSVSNCGSDTYCCDANAGDSDCCSNNADPHYLISFNDVVDSTNGSGIPSTFSLVNNGFVGTVANPSSEAPPSSNSLPASAPSNVGPAAGSASLSPDLDSYPSGVSTLLPTPTHPGHGSTKDHSDKSGADSAANSAESDAPEADQAPAGSISNSAKIGIIVGGVILTLMNLFAVLLIFQRRRARRHKDNKTDLATALHRRDISYPFTKEDALDDRYSSSIHGNENEGIIKIELARPADAHPHLIGRAE
ncbi:MAG: hypothetical protein M1838_004869 [Thelocarpon superellum]|nr:MAG: hypothetical protein M1838_004869 [Thelocarpon superellum]